MTPLQWYRHESSLVRLHAAPSWTLATWDTLDDWDDLDEDDIDSERLGQHAERCPPLTTIRRDPESNTWSVLPDIDALRDAIDDGECTLIHDCERRRPAHTLDDVDSVETPLRIGNTTGRSALKGE